MATADSGREAYTAIAWVSSRNYVARLAGLNLAFQLEEAPIGAVETLRQDRCNVKERGRVARRRETATLSPHVLRRVRLIQKHGEFAEDGTGLRHPGDLNAFLNAATAPSLRISSWPVCRGSAEHGLAGLPLSRILKGEEPGELPVQPATKYELAINLKTAKARPRCSRALAR